MTLLGRRCAGHRRGPDGPGFSLVELLVVIAIISVLAGLLLPALEEAIAAARTIHCANNERQLYLAWVNYSDSYEGHLPAYNNKVWGHPPTGSSEWQKIMAETLEPAVVQTPFAYIAKDSFLDCPVTRDYKDYEADLVFTIPFSNYGMNVWGIGGNDLWAPRKYRRVSDIHNSAAQIAFGESGDEEDYGSSGYHPQYQNVRFPHLERSNTLYCDGHVVAEDMGIILSPHFDVRFTEAPWGNP